MTAGIGVVGPQRAVEQDVGAVWPYSAKPAWVRCVVRSGESGAQPRAPVEIPDMEKAYIFARDSSSSYIGDEAVAA